MVVKNTNLVDILNSRNFVLTVGIEHIQEECTGLVNGTNKLYDVANGPIYPRRGLSVIPEVADVIVYGKKGDTYTDLTAGVKQLNTTVDSDTQYAVYTQIEFTTAPATADVDKIYCTYVEEMKPYIGQSLKVDVKQDSKSVGELGSDVKRKSVGAQEITITEDLIYGEDLEVISKLAYEEYDGTGTEQTGYTAYTMIAEPLDVWICIAMTKGTTIVGNFYYRGNLVPGSMLEVKEGDDATWGLEFNIEESPVLVMPTPA